ncbi:protein SMG8 isoform X2 [Fukomys damarensis]|uniref:protein SMG8 isoform X2 n=1 Tax=Fukomys damarensis TaxID=885580 RepID=UPI0005400B1B|nr:protein SMG8 isoform X2 [Fukomys damarensis]
MAGPVSLRELLMGASAWMGSESPGGSPTEGGGNAGGSPEPPWREDEICVVGIFGKTALRLNSEKFSLVNTVCDRQIFPLFRHQDPEDPGPVTKTETGAVGEAGGSGDPGAAAGDPVRGGGAGTEGNRTEQGSQDFSLLQAYYNQESKVLYLLLTSICDNSQLLRACRALQSGEAGGGLSLPHSEAHEFWKHQEKLQCLSLLYLFSVCHILLLVHPTCSFDITYDRVFRALDGLRQKVLPLLKTAIKDCPVGKDWKLNCRPCPPRLLFLFQLNGALKVETPRGQDIAHPDKPKKHSPKRRLQHALEDQIYRIFRKSRVLTNQSINCLFTVPANQAFVYIVPGSQEEDPVGMLLDQLRSHCTVKDPESLLVPAPLSGPRRYQVMRQHSRQQLSFHIDSSSSSSSGQLVDFTLREFLWQHVELVLSKKGFDDSVGRNPQPSHFELPTYQKWISAAAKLRARSTGACNCGRKQAPRDDPFDIKAANYDFYQLLEEKCCGKLDHINFPVFEPSTPDPAPAKNESSPAPPESDTDKLKEKEPQTQGESTSLSLALSLGQSTDSLGTYPADPQGGGDNAEVHGQGEVKPEKRPNLVDRQASTVEYLPGMLHSNCPKGLLPKFSSWSLVKLGPAKSYNFHTGLDQPGFIPGTNYLMPWDIVIRTRAEDEGDLDTNSWPAPNKAIPGKRSAVVMGRGRRRDDIARAFVGFEYEDSRGRRFMCSGPDKVMKVMGSGPKESALKALNSDMPLYILSSSQGRGLKPHYAQLMRLFVVVPDAPLQIILMPQVQPGPPPCPVFYPEKQEITLPPDGLWVLRFPYSYVTERGPCFPPKENVQLMSYKVLRGVLKAVTQ